MKATGAPSRDDGFVRATRRRAICGAIGVLALALLAISSVAMARRVSEFHRATPREIYAFNQLTRREFTYAGHPVSFVDTDEGGVWSVRVTYGSSELRLPAAIPGDRRLPDLLPHVDWLRVLRFAPATGLSLDELRAKMDRGEIADRLVIVTRTPPPGADPGKSGTIDRKAWRFDFYEFRPDGAFAHERRVLPSRKQAEAAEGDEIPGRSELILEENTWQFQAALMLMPAANAPSPRFVNDGLHAMGWTLPAAGFSTMTLLGALILAFSHRSR